MLTETAPWAEGDNLRTVKFPVQVPWLEQIPVASSCSRFYPACHPGYVLDPQLLTMGKEMHGGLFGRRR